MARTRTAHRCRHCGGVAPRWAGRCASCGSWNSLVEEAVPRRAGAGGPAGAGAGAVPIGQVDTMAAGARPTGVDELDRVLGGGLVAGSATLVGGEPGIGKSTLLLQALASVARGGARCLYVSAEESAQQVRLRADRLGALEPDLWLLAESSLDRVVAAIEEVEPEVVVVDSVQTVFDPGQASAPGSVKQVRECAHRLVGVAKRGRAGEDGAARAGPSALLVGHVTKDGDLAGPRALEHLVDTVLSFEGERHHALRLLRAVKHRFGATGALGLFEMAGTGLVGVPDASGLLLADRREGVPGSVVVPVLEGHRPLLVELQVLVVDSDVSVPRRSGQGLDGGRLAVLIALLRQQLGLSLGKQDVYASVVGGVRVSEPAADLALGLALVSAVSGQPPPSGLVACGEVGLAGEVRQVNHTARRLAEAARLGFRRAVVPRSAPEGPSGLECIRVGTLAEAIVAVGLTPAR